MTKKKFGAWLLAVSTAIAGGLVATKHGSAPPAPPSAAVMAEWDATCRAVWREELRRDIDPSGLASCVDQARRGGTVETIRATVRASDEFKALRDAPVPTPIPAPLQVRVDGRFWVTDAGTFRPIFQSGLTLLVRGPAERDAFLDETVALGFNGVRVFAGDLGWAGQTPAVARVALHHLLDAAAARGLYVYVSALTGAGYDIEAHLREVAAIVAAHPNSILEVANEVGHPTQSDIAKDPPRLLALARRAIPAGVLWTLGAPVGTDEPAADDTYPTDGGLFNDAHLDRGRDLYNQVRRLREIAGISQATKKPAMSGEPIGIAEGPITKQRLWGDDALRFSFAYGVLCRGFELGCVWHSEDGLNAQLLEPNTAAAALEFIAGWRAIETTDRLAFVNAGWPGSPVAKANFDTGLVRAYSFVAGGRGWTVLVGVRGDPAVEWGGGWAPRRVVVDRPGLQVLEIAR